MGKLAISVATAALLLTSAVWTADAQIQGAPTIHAQAQNATPIVKAACGGPGVHCRPGRHWVCGPARCWCAPC